MKLITNASRLTAGRLILLFIHVVVFPATCVAQDRETTESGTPEAAETAESLPETPEKVEVEPQARDGAIAERLSEILDATSWFADSSVRVEDGVVFLTGTASSAEHKQWASDLASKTQDVVAVVNRMSIADRPLWDFSQAYQEIREFTDGTVQSLPIVVFGAIILLATWLLAWLAGKVSDRIFRKRISNTLLRWVTTRLIMIPILIFGIYLVLRIAGLTQLALTVLGGTGLVGLVIGIAFQDIAENFLASILISLQKPFRIGDLVRLDGHEGVVQRVTTRGTTLLTPDGNHVQIPNSKIYKSTIENFTANPMRRVSFVVGIGYDDSTSDAQSIVLEKIKQHTATLNDPKPKVLLDGLGAATVNLKALFWIDGTKNDWQSVRSSCMRIAKQALLQAGISLPDEAREVIFPDGVPVLMPNEDLRADTFADPDSGNQQPKQPIDSASEQQLPERDTSEAEGNMQSEMDDLKRQAEQSWLPGEGSEVLIGAE